MTDDSYVTNAAWHGATVRPDTIDEVADQFERRPEQDGARAFWDDMSMRRAKRESVFRLRTIERRAG